MLAQKNREYFYPRFLTNQLKQHEYNLSPLVLILDRTIGDVLT